MALKYRLGEIGWYNFERLTKTLLKRVIAPGVTSFGGSKDGGRDATFSGTAPYPSPESPWSGNWVFQVKYIDIDDRGGGAAARSALRSVLKGEIEAIVLRNERIDNYILVTDIPLTSDARAELKSIANQAGHHGNFAAVDGHEVCEWLDIHPGLRRSFPQLLGLSDLSQIVHSAIYSRSKAYFQQWAPRLATFVQTDAYIRALQVLSKHYFLVLDGPPETGKSMIAAAVAMLHASEGYEIYEVRSPEQVHAIVQNPGKMLFVADDAIGSIALESGRTDEWARDLSGIVRLLGRDHLLIWTARHYILEEALAESKLGEALDHFPGEHEVVVEVGSLRAVEKAEMLYNHAKQARLKESARAVVRNNANFIVQHENFTPERIRQMVEYLRETPSGDHDTMLSESCQFLNNPGSRWTKAYRALSQSEQALLVSLLDLEESPTTEELRGAYEKRIEGVTQRRFRFGEVLRRLKHSFVTLTTTYQGIERVNFKHPSLRDLLLGELRGDATARRRYIELTSPVGLASLIKGFAENSNG